MTKKEELLLRELASGHCTIHKVTQAIGPLSLWSRDALEKKLEEARAEEREACAKVCESMRPSEREFDQRFYTACTLNANAIRARSKQ